MKKIFTILLTGILSACNVNVANSQNNNSSTLSTDITKMSAVNIYGFVSVIDTVDGSDTPIEEASDNVKKINSLKLSIYDKNTKKELESFELNKVDTRTKGEILRFEGGFKGIKSGEYNFKVMFRDDKNNIVSEKEKELKISEKKIYELESYLKQTSIKRDSKGTINTDIQLIEKKEDSFVKDQMIIGFKKEIDENKARELITKMGIKIKEIQKGALKYYNVTFEGVNLYEALIKANKDENVEYVEPNGIVTIQKLF
ncbi:MAG: hypothetical protein KatS3mg068_1853 [Candidatus Sericytochromatia bacterium]|nr:MAG: hypothetical protein KatS3mg068_1853 [Candidatus Sericytochromatia bacterium]